MKFLQANRSRIPFIVLAFLYLLSVKSWGQTKPIPTELDALLTNYAYPYPVKYFNLTLEEVDCRMAYMDVPAGNAKAPVIVLLHGKNFFGAYWRETIGFLNKMGYRVIVPDQVGFGKSSKPSLHYSFHQLARNTKELLDTLGVTKAIVVGHSMGGMLATRMALMYPELVTKLVLENPIGLEDYRTIVPYSSLQEAYQKELKTTEESIRNYHKTYYPVWKPEYEEWVKVPGAQTRSKDYKTVALSSAQTYDMIYQQPVIYELERLVMPVLLIIGQADRTVVGKASIKDKAVLQQAGQYPELGKKAAARIKNSKLVELPGVGHIPHLQAIDSFKEALTQFIK